MSIQALKTLSTLLSSLAFGLAVSQTVLESTLQELTRYYGAAAVLVAKVISGVNTVEAAQIPRSTRKEARDELRRISSAISSLRIVQRPLIFDLSEYVNQVRAGKFDAKRRESEWERIVWTIYKVSNVVKTTLDVVETSRWLKVTLDREDRLALREVLLGRKSLLERLTSLPAPGTAAEIDQLDQMNKFYRELFDALGNLNATLTRATERLKLD